MKFTPGPWKLERIFDGININGHAHAAWEVTSSGVGVCVVVLPFEDVTDEARIERNATANLIAAAPEMYEALKNITVAFNACRLIMADKDTRDMAGEIVDDARKVIAKADGAA